MPVPRVDQNITWLCASSLFSPQNSTVRLGPQSHHVSDSPIINSRPPVTHLCSIRVSLCTQGCAIHSTMVFLSWNQSTVESQRAGSGKISDTKFSGPIPWGWDMPLSGLDNYRHIGV